MKQNRIFQKWLGLAVVLACSSSVWAGFTDGFESGLGAWTTSGKVQVVTSEAPRDSTLSGNWLPTEGSHFASMWSDFPIPSEITRSFVGLAGETLQFDYYFDYNDKESPEDWAQVTIRLPDTTWLYPLFLKATTPDWMSFVYTLPADGTYQLSFEARRTHGAPASESVFGVDNVRVGSPSVPAPAAILLAGMGTGLVGWMRNRKIIH